MAPHRRRNELQARWLLSEGAIPKTILEKALRALARRSDIDLCEALRQKGLLEPARAAQARSAAEKMGRSTAEKTGRSAAEKMGRSAIPPTAPSPPSDRRPSVVSTSELSLAGPRVKAALGGPVLSKYEVLEEVGGGGMGLILKARHRAVGSEVAIKLMLSGFEGEVARERFLREAKALAALRHPNIVRLLDFGQEDGIPYIIMDWVRGQTLEERVSAPLKERRQGPEPGWIARQIKAVAEAIAYCHDQGLVHRDIKPTNIVIEEGTERPVLLDFGLVKKDPNTARDPSISSRGLSVSGEAVGTPSFMAPEQLDPKGEFGEVGAQADVWGLGATLYFCLTGLAPYRGDSISSLYVRLLTQEPTPLEELNPRAPRWLCRLVRDCMEKRSDQRPRISEVIAGLTESRPTGRRGSRRLILGGVAAVALISLAAVAWALRAPELTIVELAPGLAWSRERRVEIRGKVNRPGTELRIGVVSAVSDEDGAFSIACSLEEGANAIELKARSGSDEARRRFEIICDTLPPTLSIEGLRLKGLLACGDGRVRGVVRDRYLAELIVGGQGVSPDEGGRFELALSDEARAADSLLLVALDKAGNRARLEVPLLPEKDEQAELDALLADRQRWSEAEEAWQDRAIADVAARLGSEWRFDATERYRCGDQEHRIARFVHVKSQAALHLIPGGRFRMGLETSRALEDYDFITAVRPGTPVEWLQWEMPARGVRIRKPFLLGRFELSQEEWLRVSEAPRPLPQNAEQAPMIRVTWAEARAWAEKAGGGLRLPSEAEWEYAARAGSTGRFFWGERVNYEYLWCLPQSGSALRRRGQSSPKPNAFGLIDTLGGVFEWCLDGWYPDLRRGPANEQPIGDAEKQGCVYRGGSFANPATSARASYRDRARHGSSHDNVGLRLAADLPDRS